MAQWVETMGQVPDAGHWLLVMLHCGQEDKNYIYIRIYKIVKADGQWQTIGGRFDHLDS